MTTAFGKGRAMVVAAIIALFAVPIGVAGPAAAAPSSPVAKYVALGDSFAAGQGTGVYIDACLRSPLGYPALLDAVPRVNLLRNASCTGADFDDVDAQLAQINRGTTLVTLTIGANGVNLPGLLAACVPDPNAQPCLIALAAANTYLTTELGPEAGATIAAISSRSPNARVVVTGYPLPLAPGVADGVNLGAATLNAVLAATVSAAQAQGANVVFADVTAAFLGHGAFGPDPWLGQDPGNLETFLHPNAEGYQAYAAVIEAVR
ncbi:SGNH/GDSL hydrolase family protein [Agromyces sp. SYSU K20354]|uniref:SGNH/GDSL hydrolase family protein n=1 Tax=Agromyces cavernae TaxID=2898659 RepID=UPI001E3E84FA|nr:SGNH/GDSL hydrolase family protein [Agromyces cavernae]MCD2444199.1 SGNH/GDSL hydrolase family protein [Agromyces cavernae]